MVASLARSNTVHEGYQRTITPNKNRKILSQMNHLMKMALGESSGVEIQASVRPHGLSYAFVFRPKDGEPYVRFDNAHAVDRPGGRL